MIHHHETHAIMGAINQSMDDDDEQQCGTYLMPYLIVSESITRIELEYEHV